MLPSVIKQLLFFIFFTFICNSQEVIRRHRVSGGGGTPPGIAINKIDSVNYDGASTSPLTLSSTLGATSNEYSVFITEGYLSDAGGSTFDSAYVDVTAGGSFVKMDSLCTGWTSRQGVKMFGLKGLNAGTHTFRFYWSRGTLSAYFFGCLGSVSFNNVNQSTSVGINNSSVASTQTPTVSIANSVATDWTIDAVMTAWGTVFTPNSPQVKLYSATSADGESVQSSYKIGTSTSMNWTTTATAHTAVLTAIIIKGL